MIVWGKLGLCGVHPLVGHLADVAAVAEALLQLPLWRKRLTKILGHPPSPVLLARLLVLVSLHDLGKFATCFQLCSKNSHAGCNHLESLFGLFDRPEAVLNAFPWLCSWDASQGDMLEKFLNASFSHHGTTFLWQKCPMGRISGMWEKTPTYDPWANLKALDARLRSWFPEAFASADDGTSEDNLAECPVLEHFFAGLVMLADWIGSDVRFFPYCGQAGRPTPDTDPLPYARKAAARALSCIGLAVENARLAVIPPLSTQFPWITQPQPLQEAIDTLPLSPSGEGSLVFVEAETGSGKTEVALRHFTRLLAAGKVDGLYFANPLRFAATELHKRVTAFADRTWGGALQTVLAVPGYLRMDGEDACRLPDFQVIWSDDPCTRMVDRGWAAEHPKRFLCAPLGVGTIDQALLAALCVPHAHLRAVALQRSLLVLDEVHASDAYMTRVTCGLLALFRQLGGHVLLMSATLGSTARSLYLETWRTGSSSATATPPPLEQAVSLEYPLLAVAGTSEPALLTGRKERRGKRVRVVCHPIIKNSEAVAALAATYSDACVLVLRNTVRQARHTLRALRALLPPERIFGLNGRMIPHHSRYAAEDRTALDARVSACFGKDAPRPPLVLVATQTLEQSLDVDFDVLITDLCPADVLLQRMGRLHRHVRPKRVIQEAICHLLTPDAVDGPDWLLSREARRYGFGQERAYEHLLSVKATQIMAETEDIWEFPRDNRRLVEGATHDAALQSLAETLGGKWHSSYARYRGGNAAAGQVAFMNSLRWDKPFGDMDNRIERNSIEHVGTRLGTADRVVRFSKPLESPLGQKISRIRMPGWFFHANGAEVSHSDEDVTLHREGEALCFTMDESIFYYTETGLMTQKEWEEQCTICSQSPV